MEWTNVVYLPHSIPTGFKTFPAFCQMGTARSGREILGTHPLPGATKEGCQESFAKQFLIASNFLYNYFYILVGYIVVINT
jgi:hypothetical protein